MDLKAKYGAIKRAIRFDDVNRSLYMDVKLEDTDWHRISADEIRTLQGNKKRMPPPRRGNEREKEEKRKILLQEKPTTPHVVTDDEEFCDTNSNFTSN